MIVQSSSSALPQMSLLSPWLDSSVCYFLIS
jgi:hypothetical protein